MAKQKNVAGFKLKPFSIKLTLYAFAIAMLIGALAFFNIFNFTDLYLTLFKVVALLIILTEINIAMAYKTKGKSLDVLSMIGVFAAILTLASVILDLFQIQAANSILNPIQGIIFAVLVFSYVKEAFS